MKNVCGRSKLEVEKRFPPQGELSTAAGCPDRQCGLLDQAASKWERQSFPAKDGSNYRWCRRWDARSALMSFYSLMQRRPVSKSSTKSPTQLSVVLRFGIAPSIVPSGRRKWISYSRRNISTTETRAKFVQVCMLGCTETTEISFCGTNFLFPKMSHVSVFALHMVTNTVGGFPYFWLKITSFFFFHMM